MGGPLVDPDAGYHAVEGLAVVSPNLGNLVVPVSAAVLAVLFFHAGFPWARGGYLGVSTFFTLSGFLITSLLLVEHGATGRVALGRFWSRRLRRLLPASALTLAAVAIGSQVFDELAVDGLRGDLLASLFQVANWRFIFDDQSYAALFSSPSPLLHFWSLAIEEQFYLLWPIVLVILLAVTRTVLLGLATFSLEAGNLPEVLPGP